MKQFRGIAPLIVTLAVATSFMTLAGESTTFDQISTPYEAIRQSLLNDSMDGVVEAAGSIGRDLDAMGGDFSEKTAGVRPGARDDLRPVLPAMRTATDELRKATTIDEAREAFGSLSKEMVRYRSLVPEPGSVVVFCSMAKKVWLQPKGDIGNPYYGQSMATCGEIVSE
jgi:hypothetical protein